MPTLTVRALGELLYLPLYQQPRILTEQKYPKQEPAVYRVPYYATVLNAIRRYYRSANNTDALTSAVEYLEKSSFIDSKKENNIAVIQAFLKGSQRKRKLAPEAAATYTADLVGLELKLTPSLIAAEDDDTKYIIYNFPPVSPPGEVVRAILDLAGYVLEENGVEFKAKDVEFISLRENKLTRVNQIGKASIKRARQTAKIIAQLWPTL